MMPSPITYRSVVSLGHWGPFVRCDRAGIRWVHSRPKPDTLGRFRHRAGRPARFKCQRCGAEKSTGALWARKWVVPDEAIKKLKSSRVSFVDSVLGVGARAAPAGDGDVPDSLIQIVCIECRRRYEEEETKSRVPSGTSSAPVDENQEERKTGRG